MLNKSPIFNKGEIIDKEMLDLLRDNPMNLINTIYGALSDGVICGMDIVSEDDFILVKNGMFKFAGELYFFGEEKRIAIPEEEGKFNLKIFFEEEHIKNKKIEKNFDVYLCKDNEIREREFFLGEFLKQPGTYLRYPKDNFQDFGTNYNMINIINQKKACSHLLGTLNQKIVEAFGRELLKKDNLSSMDENFAMLCINDSVKRESITAYISYKSKVEAREYENSEIYEGLKDILESLKNFGGDKNRKIKRVPRMLID